MSIATVRSGNMPGDPKKIWLNRFVNVQKEWDREVYDMLVAASEDAEQAVHELYGRQGVGAKVRRAQLTGAQGVISRILHNLFGTDLKNSIASGQSKASVAAVKAANVWDDKILREVISDSAKRKVFQRGLEETAERNVGALITRITSDPVPLSRKVYSSEALARRQIDRIVNSGLAKGDGADDIARKAHKFINPSTPGGATFAARRLGRTEINNAFHAQSINQMQTRPWVGQIEWRLSGSHTPRPGDLCERYARTKTFPARGIPLKPHPQCFCYIIPVVPDIDYILDQLESGVYHQWIDDNGLVGAR